MIAIAIFAAFTVAPAVMQNAPAKIDAPQEIMPAIGPYGNCLGQRLNSGLQSAQTTGGMTAEQLEALKVDVFKQCESAKRDAQTSADVILEDEGFPNRKSRQDVIDRALSSIEQPVRDFGKTD